MCLNGDMETTPFKSRSISKPGVIRIDGPCSRCGGEGGSRSWAFTGYTCWRCAGVGREPGGIKQYAYPADWTDEQITEHMAKRQAAADKRKAADTARKAAAAKAARAEFAAANPEAVKILRRWAKHDEFVADLARQYAERGDLSDRQIEVLLQAPAKIKARQAREKAEAERMAQATPVPTGTEQITGEVLTLKWVEGDYGSTLKMLVMEDRGFKVWGTCPRAIQPEKGDRVSLLAAVEPSHDDPLFGFYKRPRNASVIEASHGS